MAGSQQALLSSGSIKLVELLQRSYYKFSISPADAYAGIQYTSAGDQYKAEGTTLSYTDTGANWLLVGSSADYWMYMEWTGGAGETAPQGSAYNSWLQLSTTRSWHQGVTGLGTKYSYLTVKIATDSGGSNIIATAAIYLEAAVEQ